MGRHIWVGDYSGRVKSGAKGWDASEILAQIDATRANPGASGNIHFNMNSLMESPDGLSERMKAESYRGPALIPSSPWLRTVAPGRPLVSVRGSSRLGTEIAVSPTGSEEVFLWTVRARTGSDWSTKIVSGTERTLFVPGQPEQIVVSAIGRTENESLVSVMGRDLRNGRWVAVAEPARELARSLQR
jgi:hypothetical protein